MMRLILSLYFLAVVWLIPDRVASSNCASSLVDVDFEDGSIGDGWFDESRQDLVQWRVLNKSSWNLNVDHSINNAQAPNPSSNYLQLIRTSFGAFAVSELRSVSFTASPGDRIEFSFWIQSKFPQFNNLELFMAMGAKETQLLSLGQYSTPENRQWKTTSIEIPVQSPTNITLVFYGYCGTDAVLDGIAIDDIQLNSSSVTSDSCSTSRPTCPPYDPSVYTCVCGTTFCQLQRLSTTYRPWPTTFQCPPSANLAPCICMFYSGTNTSALFCAGYNLDDARVSYILNAFLSPWIAPLTTISLHSNLLTRVPNQIRQFSKLDYVNLNSNLITAVTTGSFNIAVPFVLELTNNPSLTTIEEGAFQGNFDYGYFYLSNNGLTRFESGVFQPILEQSLPYFTGSTSFVNVSGNPFDCTSDPCHMAWLIRDHRNLLPLLSDGATCNDGTRFVNLDPLNYDSCPS